MSLKSKMNEAQMNEAQNNVREKLYKSERAYRLDRRVDAWSKVPELGTGLKSMDEATARNLACNLDNQAAHMSRLTEMQMSQGFHNFTPENMLRLVRLAMPNCVRNKLFTEFAMETARDSIKYVRPVYSRTFNKNELVDRTEDFNRLYEDDTDGLNDINAENYRRPMYESTEDRITQNLANALVRKVTQAGDTAAAGDDITLEFRPLTNDELEDAISEAGANTKAVKAANEEFKASQKWGENGSKYIPGYVVVYYDKETEVIAIEDKRTGKFMVNSEYSFLDVTLTNPIAGTSPASVKAAIADGAEVPADFDLSKIKAFGRYDNEDDFEGNYLGEVEIKMSDYEFRPQPTMIGVTWSQMSEIVLDTSFNMSTEEYLVTYASQAIKLHLDYQAIKMAYRIAVTNPEQYHVEFDAAYNTTNAAVGATGTKDGYRDNAQTFVSAVETLADNMLDDINRGGVTRMVAGTSAGTYMMLMSQFTEKGATQNEGVHQIGELSGKPVFKAPKSIIPGNKVLTIFKNPQNEADISIAFGTLIPFVSSGVIQRKTLYKEAALATYGDWHCINRRYLGLITINNMKDKVYGL